MSAMRRFAQFLQQKQKPLVFGMVHLRPLPGSPLNTKNIKDISKIAQNEAAIYAEYDLDGIIVENMGDLPYLKPNAVNPETASLMTRCALDMKNSISSKCAQKMLFGVQTLAACNKEALAIALAAEYDFIRCEGFVFGHVADEGYIDGCAGDLLRYRKFIGANDIAVITDIKKKHSSHAITADVNLVETAEAAKFFLADGVVITGTATGKAASSQDVKDVKSAHSDLPVLVGSGVTAENVADYSIADALIVGSHFKEESHWSNELDERKVRNFMQIMNGIRNRKVQKSSPFDKLLVQ